MAILARRRNDQPNVSMSPFRSMFDAFNEDPFFSNFFELKPGMTQESFPIDISEGKGEIIVRASLPGFKKDEIDVEVHEGMLTISGQHSEEHEESDEKFFKRERAYGSVQRSISLPAGVNTADAKAELKDGVLTLRFPQSEEALPKKVKIG